MSCGAVLAIALLTADPAVAASLAAPVATPDAPVAVADEPLFRDIVARAGGLKARVEAWTADGAALAADFPAGSEFQAFKADTAELARLDMQAHLVLAERDIDGDLKCILRGISEDLPVRIAAVEASHGPERTVALSELIHLLDDNVAVITTPPPAS